ncbi:MbcA/ParS/Xre antitoxin family protein [Pseudomonas sp. DCB_CB]|uniref:MbcA/ParS/Xre antitoxin family protein n=1 Tax=Pseudomonas TaxID=286 RepID=UPI0022499977|nr:MULTISPECIES: MbcA/ParS/Xre antitoxin family protein [unclassified Pseudomonas]MCX2690104.1 MbcA/ParS/Xre antitoxin family protein [Pseudomonas sp. DCB_BZ]MCX2855728.1 MbcA/ParS/Xre antitoxin family protein [Pseudomonas sp. DCB_CB]
MDSENEKAIRNRHQALLGGVTEPEALFYFECGDGWVSLIDGMLSLIGKYSAEPRLEIRVEQVKEKFGLLRTYIRGGDVVVDRILDIAEMVSSCTCEVCGETGRYFEVNGWLQVRCLAHQLPNKPDAVICRYNEAYAVNFAKTVSLVLWFFKDKYASWLTQECLALGRVLPVEALTSIQGCQAIHDLLKRVEHGVVV